MTDFTEEALELVEAMRRRLQYDQDFLAQQALTAAYERGKADGLSDLDKNMEIMRQRIAHLEAAIEAGKAGVL